MKSGISLKDRIFGSWLVLDDVPIKLRRHKRVREWRCRCLGCGFEYIVIQQHLTNGKSTQCILCKGQQSYKESEDLTGKQINHWFVIGKCTHIVKGKQGNRKDYWICKCDICNQQHLVRHSYLVNNRSTKCKHCSKNKGTHQSRKTPSILIQEESKNKKVRGKNHFNWTGYEDIPGGFFTRLTDAAAKRGIYTNITIEDVWIKFLEQNKRCALSGEELSFDIQNQTASVDRIDSNKGYTKDNIQIIHKYLNTMKWDLTQEEFIEWCGKVWSFNNGKKETG